MQNGDDAVVEEMPMELSRSRALMDPTLETEAVKRQQALFSEQARLRQLKREDSTARRWAIVSNLAVPAGVVIVCTALLGLVLLVINQVAATFWNNTHWMF